MAEVAIPVHARLDTVGSTLRQKQIIDLVSEVLVGADDAQAPEWWRRLADRFDLLDEHESADRFRQIAAVIEECRL